MIGKNIILLICLYVLYFSAEAQKSTEKKSFLLYQFTASQYPESPNGPKNLDDKAYSYGFGLNYWKLYRPKIWLTAGYQGTFSSFAPLFIKGDSIGVARFTSQLDLMAHLYAFKSDKAWNLFIGGGLGAGIFADQFALYTPVGVGISHYFREGLRMILQAQWRQPITDGITTNYLHYSIGFAQTAPRVQKKKPTPLPPPIIPVVIVKDRDQDGIVDSLDLCPDQKGGLKGCPDGDEDLVADNEDACPNIKGLKRYNGCPIPDRDTDGVNDEEDACPDTAGLAENKGCPPPDRDGDGVSDNMDECPDIAGLNAFKGCPEIISVANEKAKYAASNILFKFASDEMLPSSFTALNEVVKIMREDSLLIINIEAHADSIGTSERNLILSEKRAKSVAKFFISKGIAPERMSSKGYGDTKPIADNTTEAGRARNRRVELIIGY